MYPIKFLMNQNSILTLNSLIEHIDGAYAPNTIRAYRVDFLEFVKYCDEKKKKAISAEPNVISEFLMTFRDTGLKMSTIKRKVSSISAVNRLLDLDDPTKHSEVQIACRKLLRLIGNRFNQAHPINNNALQKLIQATGSDLRGHRDRTLIMLGYDSMRRRSELVSLRVEDIEWDDQKCASILLRKSKTDRMGQGKWIHLSLAVSQQLRSWLDQSNISEGFIFRGVNLKGKITNELGPGQVGRIYKQLARKATVDESQIKHISGHSMRVGAAQDLLLQGASLGQIMIKGGWTKTDTVMRYVERVAQHLHAL